MSGFRCRQVRGKRHKKEKSAWSSWASTFRCIQVAFTKGGCSYIRVFVCLSAECVSGTDGMQTDMRSHPAWVYSIKTLIGIRCISCLFTVGYLVKLLTSSSATLADLQASRYGLRSNSKKKKKDVLCLFLDTVPWPWLKMKWGEGKMRRRIHKDIKTTVDWRMVQWAMCLKRLGWKHWSTFP